MNLVERLRLSFFDSTMEEAADRIEQLEKQRDELLADLEAARAVAEGNGRLRDDIEDELDAALKTVEYWKTIRTEVATWADEEITKLTAERDELLDAATRCYKMLLSEPDTKGALFKTENILREMIADMQETK